MFLLTMSLISPWAPAVVHPFFCFTQALETHETPWVFQHTLAVCAYPGHSNMPYEICSDRRHCQIKRKFFQKTWKITKINEKKNVNRNVKIES